MPDYRNDLEHILLPNSGQAEEYKFPYAVKNEIRIPPRQRAQHAGHLQSQISAIKLTMEQVQARPDAAQYPHSVVLEFQGESQYDLATKSLETPTQGLTLLNVREDETSHKLYATVRVEDDRALATLERKIEAYRTSDTRTGKPKNRPLVETVSDISLARIQAFWTDRDDLFPTNEQQKIWWEIWLLDEPQAPQTLRAIAGAFGLQASDRELFLVERVVVLLEASAAELEHVLQRCHVVSEIRRAIELAPFFGLRSNFLSGQLDHLVQNVTGSNPSNIFITVLDTGVNRGHALLSPFIGSTDLLTCNAAWQTNDHHGHGTGVAGLSLYGDLSPLLSNPQPVVVGYCLESVKILPPNGQGQTPPDLYGAVTIQAATLANSRDEDRRRIFCMTVTDRMTIDRGKPSSWSAALDEISFGKHTGKRQLFFISGGNMEQPGTNYMNDNIAESIHDPGQAWNAVTVGAYTEKMTITETGFADWQPLAQDGGLCPSSTTSNVWANTWPLKPEVVFEGGNMAIPPDGSSPNFDAGLSLITTGHRTLQQLDYFGETSAATAQAARFAALLQDGNPDMWPETVRALMVHSTSWTQAMLDICPGFPHDCSKTGVNSIRSLIRTYGYGVPNLQKALHSATDCLTLVVEQDFEPYIEDDEGNQARQINYHALPWPLGVLQDMGGETVRLRVTLSYFIEPNPARRDRQPKHLYRSFGLRFAVKSPLETEPNFKRRLNGVREDGEVPEYASDVEHWIIGARTRDAGSLHSDIWTGTAAQLAECGLLAVYPVNGWWKDKFDRLPEDHRRIRYSLIVSIETPRQDVDIYTPVFNEINGITVTT
jgi:hypothetical protein